MDAYNIYRAYLEFQCGIECSPWQELSQEDKEAWERVEKELRGVPKNV